METNKRHLSPLLSGLGGKDKDATKKHKAHDNRQTCETCDSANEKTMVHNMKYGYGLDNTTGIRKTVSANGISLDDLSISNITDLDEKSCPVFIKYNTNGNEKSAVIIGRGKEGIVLKIIMDKEIGPKEYALKISPVDEYSGIDDGAYQEVRINYILSNFISNGKHDDIEDIWCNIIKMYDWTKCQFTLSSYIEMHVGPYDMEKYEKMKNDYDDAPDITHELIILEYADKGTLLSFIRSQPQYFFKSSLLIECIGQVGCTMDNLAQELGVSHNDLHLENILVEKLAYDMDGPVDLAYNVTLNGKTIEIGIALSDSDNHLFKISDFGLSYIALHDPETRDLEDLPIFEINGSFEIEQSNEGIVPFTTDIRYDMHKFGCCLMRELLDIFRLGKIDKILVPFETIFPLIHNEWKSQKNIARYNALKDLRFVLKYGGVFADITYKDTKKLVDQLMLGQDTLSYFSYEYFAPPLKNPKSPPIHPMYEDAYNKHAAVLKEFGPFLALINNNTGALGEGSDPQITASRKAEKKDKRPRQIKDMHFKMNIDTIDYEFEKTNITLYGPDKDVKNEDYQSDNDIESEGERASSKFIDSTKTSGQFKLRTPRSIEQNHKLTKFRKYKTETCSYCHASASKIVCGGCDKQTYCTEDHRSMDWTSHSVVCLNGQ